MIGFLALAFLGGLLSCASTCFLPLVPAYVAYMGGRALSPSAELVPRQQARVMGNAVLFVAGFSTVFIVFGAGAGLIGADIRTLRPALERVAGIALVVMGLALLGFIPWLMREFRADVGHRLRHCGWSSYVVGLAFAVGWTPCVGPILAAVLIKAADTATASQGALLLAAYSVGLAIPFLVMAGVIGKLTRFLPRIYAASRAVNGLAAAFMIGMGLLIFTNRLTVLNSVLPYFTVPFEQSLAGTTLANQSTPALPASGSLVGKPAPAFTVTDIAGHQLTLASLRGRPVLINFWATWCTPCREELPLIMSAYRAHRDQGFTVVEIDYEESGDTVKQFWSGLRLDTTPYLDPDGRVATTYGVGLRSSGLPVSVFVTRDGMVQAYSPWALDPTYLDTQLNAILGKGR